MTTVRYEAIELSSDFACGAADEFRQLGRNHFQCVVSSDPFTTEFAPSYNSYFCISTTSLLGETRQIAVDALRPAHAEQDLQWSPTRVPLFVSDDFRRWYVLDGVEASTGHLDFRAHVQLLPFQKVYLAYVFLYPPELMNDRLRESARHPSGWATVHVLGQSVRGRDILLLSISDPTVDNSLKERVLVTSGLHPAEPDWLATMALIENLMGDDEWARRIRQEFIVDVVVQVNPDGVVLGTNGCNARGINLYWDFRMDNPENCPEAVHLWRWIEAHPPCLYIDFHAYVHQLHKDVRPYIRPVSDYARGARPLVRAIDRQLISLCHGRKVRGSSTNFQTTLAARITAAFGTITYPKFHLHLNHGVPACRQLGLDAFKTIIDAARPYRPLRQRMLNGRRYRSLSDHVPRWWEQGVLPEKLRRLWIRVGGRLGWQHPQTSFWRGPGLAPHWRNHLWSQKDQVQPVIVIDR